MKLTPAREAKKAKGMFMVWKTSRPPFPGETERVEQYRIALVAKKQGETLISDRWQRVNIWEAWLVESDCGWPKWDDIGYQPLSKDEAREILNPEY